MITHILSLLSSLTPEQLARVEEVKGKHTCITYTDANKTIYLSKSGDYTSRICSVWFYCDCASFLYSGKGNENKTPCKHLIALACWVDDNQ